jgi:hypothetical protein
VAEFRSRIAGRLPPQVRSRILALRGDPNGTAPAGFPSVPAGWRTAPPDFVGVGAQKAGTSWWYSLLAQHPGVVVPRSVDPRLHKELHFFDRYWDPQTPRADVESYQRYFPRPVGALSGEWTPRYMADPWTIPLLARVAPATKILVLLRDPVDRYLSGFRHGLERGLPRQASTAADAFYRGLYATQLRVVLDHFDPGQVLIQQYEACRRAPAKELTRTLGFLGLDAPSQMPVFDKPVNSARRAPEPMDPGLRESLVSAYRWDCRELVRLVPEIDLSLWTSFREPSQAASAGR